jgi:hypothetical protein
MRMLISAWKNMLWALLLLKKGKSTIDFTIINPAEKSLFRITLFLKDALLPLAGAPQCLSGLGREEERPAGRSPGVDRKSSVRSRGGCFYGGSGGQR